MATLDNLITIYRNVHRIPAGVELTNAAQNQLSLMAGGIDAARNGQVGDLWSYGSAVRWIQDSAKATTQVAVMSYGFLADLPLSTTGIDYLVSATGANPNNLNSAYYAGFSLENRFINFAINLVKQGEACENFVQEYGLNGTTYATYQKAYFKLFGHEVPIDEVIWILAQEIPNGRGGSYTRGEYFVELGGDGGNGLGTRSAVVGWLMAEAVKGGQGPYVEATRSYLAGIAIDGKAPPISHFMSYYGPGGDEALGGGGDPGLPGESARFAHDWNVDAFRPNSGEETHILASDGNDVIKPVIVDGPGGLDAGRHIYTAGGNDVVYVDTGYMRGHIDTGTGNDSLFIERLDGRITTGSGYDNIDLGSFAELHQTNGRVSDIAVIDDFQKGFDLLTFPAFVGTGEKKAIQFVQPVTFDQALAAYSSATVANSNTVFEWDGDTYIYHQNGVAGVDAGDGLIKLAGVVGLTVGRFTDAVDIAFAA